MLDRYILRSNLGLFAGLTLIALAMLMLARLIRLSDLLSGSQNAIGYGARLLASLVPHYLDLAAPGALLIAVIVGTDRLSRSGEVVAMMAAGMPLWRIARPFVMLGVALAAASVVVSGYVQPLARYNFRAIVAEVERTEIASAFREQRFVQSGSRTVWTAGTGGGQGKGGGEGALGETFIVETLPDGGRRFLTGRSGTLRQDEGGQTVIALGDAMIGEVPARIAGGAGDRFLLREVELTFPGGDGPFRARGTDQRELTLGELLSGAYRGGPYPVTEAAAGAELHDRLARAAVLAVLPVLGVALGLRIGRGRPAGGVAAGILVLLVAQKVLENGKMRAGRGEIPDWAGAWPAVAAVAILALVLFRLRSGGRGTGRAARDGVGGGVGALRRRAAG
jgi:lipopolysaccharide export system permease protein